MSIDVQQAEAAHINHARRFGGLERLYGINGAARIRSSHVMVVGIGGVGSWAVEALARSGVGRITLVDMDHVSESNINRQVHATQETFGQSKIVAMQERIALINPACHVICIDDFVTLDNWHSIVPTDVSVVIDACDQVHAKVAMAAWAMVSSKNKALKPLFITVGAAGGKRLAHLVDIDDLSKTTHDPLLAQLRYRLRKEHGAAREGKKIGVNCVFSKESVLQPNRTADAGATDNTLNCSGYGSVVSVTATFGQCAAGWALDKLANLAKI